MSESYMVGVDFACGSDYSAVVVRDQDGVLSILDCVRPEETVSRMNDTPIQSDEWPDMPGDGSVEKLWSEVFE